MAISPFLREELSSIFEEEIARLRADDLLRKAAFSCSPKADDIAQAYMRATPQQQRALEAVIASWGQT